MKGKKTKAKKIIKTLLIIFAVLVVALLIFLIPLIRYINIWDKYDAVLEEAINKEIEPIDITMTKEERLRDFEALYEYGVKANPSTVDFEKIYGINMEEMYNAYIPYVEACKSEYDYYKIIFSFMRNMPSGHTIVHIPNYYNNLNVGFQQGYESLLKKNADRYVYSWEQTLRENINKCSLDANLYIFQYLNGEYNLSYVCDLSDEYKAAKMLSVNGVSPEEYIKGYFFFSALEYDDYNEQLFRDNLYFNDKYGTPVDIELELFDGTYKTVSMYVDFDYEMAFNIDNNYNYIDKNMAKLRENNSEDNSSSSGEENYNYEIVYDESKDVVYFNLTTCVISDAEAAKIVSELKEALTKSDNLIFDLRDNSGGQEILFSTVIYPILFKNDDYVENEVILTNNKMTRKYTGNLINLLVEDIDGHSWDDYYTYKVVFDCKGQAEKDYNIYVLTSETTFSAADIATYICNRQDNVTIIGTNTGGEGMDGLIFAGILPKSHLMFSYCPSRNADLSTTNSVTGVVPDYYMFLSKEDILYLINHRDEGEKRNLYNERLKWDSVLLRTIDMINE